LPYVTTAEWKSLPPEIHDYEPRSALDGGAEGLTLIEQLLAMGGAYLCPGGTILLEIGAGQGSRVMDLARRYYSGARTSLHKDYARLDRLVVIKT
jgi:release factor glutamine methyltransferase